MTIQYILSNAEVVNLAHTFATVALHSDAIVDDLTTQRVSVSSYQDLTQPNRLVPLAQRHYDDLFNAARKFAPDNVVQIADRAEVTMEQLVRESRTDSLADFIERLPDEVLWEIYSRIYDVMMSFGVAKELIDKHLAATQGSRLLDIGAGTGRIAVPEYARGLNVVAIEPDAAMRHRLMMAARLVQSESMLTIMPTFYTPQLGIDGVFDHIVMKYVLYLFSDHRSYLARVFDLLPAGGLFSVSNPIPMDHDSAKFRQFADDLKREMAFLNLGWKENIMGPINRRLAKNANFISREHLAYLLTEIGFAIEASEDVRTGFFVTARKTKMA